MANLYVYGTGGSGIQVMKAFVFLLAAGAKLENVDAVIPIIIDPHLDNAALESTVRLIENYRTIRASLKQEPREGDFFYTKLTSLKEKSNRTELKNRFTFEMVGDDKKANRFRDYIDYRDLDDVSKPVVDLLFSEENLATEMEIGFVGNPNIGSVVLNQIGESNEFDAFASAFNKGDRIFIVSSIFGGTGASAFPILLKNIRGCSNGQQELVKKAMVGALTLMPYFKVSTPKNGSVPGEDYKARIAENTFKAKTKAALHYYLEGVNPFVDRLYGIADRAENSYHYDPGEKRQELNKSHFVEMIGATAIFDFMGASATQLSEAEPIYLEYGLSDQGVEKGRLTFTSIPMVTRKIVEKPLTKLTFLLRHLRHIDRGNNYSPAWTKSNDGLSTIDDSFKGKDFYRRLKQLLRDYEVWLKDMEANVRSFKPFHTDPESPLDQTLSQIVAKNNKAELDHEAIDEFLSQEAVKTGSFPSPEDKLMRIFSTGLQAVLTKYY